MPDGVVLHVEARGGARGALSMRLWDEAVAPRSPEGGFLDDLIARGVLAESPAGHLRALLAMAPAERDAWIAGRGLDQALGPAFPRDRLRLTQPLEEGPRGV